MVASRKRILVVDDNLVVQDILREFLGRGYLVDAVTNASQALGALIRRAPDAVLLDVKIPGMDGLSLLRSLREMGVRTPILVMTGYPSAAGAEEALTAGASAYLTKPFDLLELDRLLAEALGAAPVWQPQAVAG